MEKRLSFQRMVLEQLDIHMQKIKNKQNNLDTELIHFTKINSKQIIDLNIKRKTIKFLGDNIEENLGDLGYNNDFLDTIPKAQSMKEMIDENH